MRYPVLLGSEIYSTTAMGSRHPLAWPKTAPTLELIRNFEWYDAANYLDIPKISPRRIKMFHDSSYVDAAFDAETRQEVPKLHRSEYGLGTGDNPIFPGVIHRAAMACGAAIQAADLLIDDGVVHSPLGGAHHAEHARASGFGYFNDIVIGILRMLDNGLQRVAYVDLDAHHGNAVEDTFAYDRNVQTFSIHQENCWPYGGTESNPDYGVFNLPVPANFNDTEMNYLLHDAILPWLESFNAEAIVVQAGADSLAADRMMGLSLSNRAYFETINALQGMAPRLWVTGGGGYNPWAVTRCWAGIWCVLNGRDPVEDLSTDTEQNIVNLVKQWPSIADPPSGWLSALQDDPLPGPLRDAVKASAHRTGIAN